MNYFEQIEAMHQEVREFVEQAEPDYKVAEIEADFKTSYKPKFTDIEASFRVNAYAKNRLLDCKVYIMPDGKLYLANQVVHRFTLMS